MGIFSGVNQVCAQCVLTCKQFRQVILWNCTKFESKRVAISQKTNTPITSRRKGSPTSVNKRCPICLMTKRMSEHHIKPVSQGGLSHARNIIYVCSDCHDRLEEYADEGVYYTPSLGTKIRLSIT